MKTPLEDASLQDVNGGALKPHLPEPLARDTRHYLVEYGIRLDDRAMVFHFFPPKDKDDWDPEWPMNVQLEAAIQYVFDVSKVSAGFVPEMNSFYVIVGGLGAAPDPWPVVDRFFRYVDGTVGGTV